MSNYTPIIENAQPIAHYNCNDSAGDIVDNIGALNFVDNSLITYQQTGALLGEPLNKAILLSDILETPDTLDTSTFGTEFACEFWIKPDTSFVLNIGDSFRVSFNENGEVILPENDKWNSRGSILQASDADNEDYFGAFCSLSGDGNVLIVGASAHEIDGSGDTDTGAVYTYDRLGDLWIQRGSILVPDIQLNNTYFGVDGALSNDGNVLVVGASGYAGNQGAVYTYDRNGSSWTQRAQILQASDGVSNDNFGFGLALSNDTTVLAVGSYRYDVGGVDSGAVYTYDLVGVAWTERNILQANVTEIASGYGVSCSLSGDAKVLAVGAFSNDTAGTSAGAVYTYDLVGVAWIERPQTLTASDNSNSALFGRQCKLSNDGTIVVVSARAVAQIYTYDVDNSGNWVERSFILTANDHDITDNYGNGLAISNDASIIAVGANRHETAGTNHGAVYTYDMETSNKAILKDNYNSIVLNYSNDTLGIYLNGNLYHISYQTPTFNATEYIRIQGNAVIDELAVYDRRLSDVEIQAHFINAKQFDAIQTNISNTQPIAYFPMGDNIDDMQSIHGNIQGKYHNSPLLEQIGKHDKSVLFDGVNQYAEIYSPSGISDKYFDDTVLSINCEGVIGSNDFIDSSNSNHAITAVNHSYIDSFGKFRNSVYFDGLDDRLTVPDSADFHFGSDDFTVEFYIFPVDTLAAFGIIIGQMNFVDGLSTQWALAFQSNDTIQLRSASGGSWDNFVTTSPLNLYEWHHISLVGYAGDLKIYVNGVEDGVKVGYVAFGDASDDLTIGNGATNLNDFKGYLSNIRITKLARYTEDFTPPQSREFYGNKIPVSIGDEHFDDTVLLLHLEGENLSNTITDSSNANIGMSFNGGGTLNNGQSKFGNTSAYFDGSNDYLHCEVDTTHRLTKYDFTMELQIYKTAAHDGVNEALISMWGATPSVCEFFFHLSTTTIGLAFRQDNRSTYISSLNWNWIPTLNTWHHIALVKQDTTYTMYIDGVSLGDIVEPARMNAYNENVQIGVLGNGSGTNYWYQGYMDEIRITRGAARYLENFTPPTKPFEDRGLTYNDWEFGKNKDKHWFDTVYHQNFEGDAGSNYFFDHSFYRHNTSEAGSTNSSPGTKKFGNKSVRFDGSGDYIIENGIADRLAGKNRFVIEAWYRNENNNASTSLWAFNGNTGSINRFGLWTNTFSTTFGGNTGYSFNVPIITIQDTWVHIACVYDNGFFNIYRDGVNVLSRDIGNNTMSTADTFRIATELDSGNSPGNYLHGNCDDFRVTWDSIRYTDEFEPPIRANPIGYGTFEHTVECWFNMVSVTGGSFNTIFSKGTDKENALIIQDEVFATTGTIQYFYNDILAVTGTDIAIGLATWNHIAVTFEQYAITIFLNGSAIARMENIAPDIKDKSFFIGSDSINTYPTNAYISDFVIHDRALKADEIFNRYNEFEPVTDDNSDLYYNHIKQLGVSDYYKCDNKGDALIDEIGDKHLIVYDKLPVNEVDSLLPADPNNKAYYVNGSYARLPYDVSTYTLPASISITVNVNNYSSDFTQWWAKGGLPGPEVDGSGVRDATIFGILTSVDATNPNELYFWSITDGITHKLGFIPNLNQTYHLTLVMNLANLSLYVDGELFTSLDVPVSFIGKFSTIGRNPAVHIGATEDYTIDEILVFQGKSLTASEIKSLYTASQLSFTDVQNYYDFIDDLAPMHYYKLNDNAINIVDSVGGLDGVLTGNSFDIDYPGYLNIDSDNRAIELGDAATVNFVGSPTFSGDFTISFYVKLSTADTTKRELIQLGGMAILYQSGFIQVWIGSLINTTIPVSENTSVHVTITSTGANFKYYGNGSYVGIRTQAHSITSLNLFANLAFTSHFSLDEVMLFDRILSDTEIADVYNRGQAHGFGTEIPEYDSLVTSLAPVHYYKMNDISVDIVDEIAGYNGVLSGAGYYLQNTSLMSDKANKSIKFQGVCEAGFPDTVTFPAAMTISFIISTDTTDTTQKYLISPQSQVVLFINATDSKLRIWNSVANIISEIVITDIPQVITVVIDGTTTDWYCNGTFVNRVTGVNPNFIGFVKLMNVVTTTKTTLDELMFFDRKLNSAEIRQLHQSSFSTLNKDKSYADFLFNTRPTNYYPLNESTSSVVDRKGFNDGTLAGVSYTQQYGSMLFSDVNNKSTYFENAKVTLDANASVIVRTLSFNVNIKAFSPNDSIAFLMGATKTYAYIHYPSHKLTYYDTDQVYSNHTFELNRTYHIVINYFDDHVEFYIDGKKDVFGSSYLYGVTNQTLTADTISTIAEDNGNVVLDEIVVYTERNLLESEIYQVFELKKFDFELLTGYRIRGTTQIEGSYRPLDVRLYQHDTGGLLSSIVSKPNGDYEFIGLHNIEYDLVFFEDGKYTTCQEIYMGVYPELYQY